MQNFIRHHQKAQLQPMLQALDMSGPTSGRYFDILGVSLGDRVAVQVDKSPEDIFALPCLFAPWVVYVFCPENGLYRRQRIGVLFRRCRSQLCLYCRARFP